MSSNFAVIGAAHLHMKDLLLATSLYPNVRIMGIYDDDPRIAEYWSGKFHARMLTLEEIGTLFDVDGLFVYSETSKHEHIVPLLPTGVPVFVEKPLGVDPKDAAAVFDFLTREKRIFHCGYLLRCLKSLRKMNEMLPAVGRVQRMELSFVHGALLAQGFDACKWMVERKYTGDIGGFGDLAIHLIDAAEVVLGERLQPYSAILQFDRELAEVDVGGAGVLYSENGVIVEINASIVEEKGLIRMRVCGTQGYLHYQDGELVLCDNEGHQTLLTEDHPGAEYAILAFLKGVVTRDYREFVSPEDAYRQVLCLNELYSGAKVISPLAPCE